MREICDRHDILLIFDEVITGFGRAGSRTGAEEFGVVPDILNLAKQLTNGAVPMGAVVTSETIYDAFMEAPKPLHAVELPHGYTYSGHPVACAAALAALDLLVTEGLIERVRNLAVRFERYLHELRDAPHVVDIRNYGLAGAVQLQPRDGDAMVRPYEAGLKMWEAGFYVRWGGDTLQFGPPFVAEASDLEAMFERLATVLPEVA